MAAIAIAKTWIATRMCALASTWVLRIAAATRVLVVRSCDAGCPLEPRLQVSTRRPQKK